MAVLYILQSERDGRFYVGSTVDLRSRMRHHRGGFTHSTKRFGKLRLAFTQEYATLAMARSIEHKLKRMKRRDFVEKIIRDGSITMTPDNEE